MIKPLFPARVIRKEMREDAMKTRHSVFRAAVIGVDIQDIEIPLMVNCGVGLD